MRLSCVLLYELERVICSHTDPARSREFVLLAASNVYGSE